MDYEKKYNEAFEAAKKELGADRKEWKVVQQVLHNIFPQLRESEDERIRKAIIELLKEVEEDETYTGRQHIPDMLSYLEKQKEQKSLSISAASEWLREHVCHYVNSEYNEFHKCVEYDGSIDKERLINDFEEAMQKEQKPAEWSEEDEKKIGRLRSVVNQLASYTDSLDVNGDYCEGDYAELDAWLKALRPVKQEWSEDDKNMWTHLNGYLNGFSCSENAIKQMADWFYELPNRFNLQPKQEWSKEDENKMKGSSEIPNDIEDAAEDFGKRQGLELRPFANKFFIAGAKWDREQMMKEAVEGEIAKDNRGNNVLRVGLLNNGFEIGDKVRIIIINQDKK